MTEERVPPRALKWDFDDSRWEALSRYHDDDLQFTWVIRVTRTGQFHVNASSPKLIGSPHGAIAPFSDLDGAQKWCNWRENNVGRIDDEQTRQTLRKAVQEVERLYKAAIKDLMALARQTLGELEGCNSG